MHADFTSGLPALLRRLGSALTITALAAGCAGNTPQLRGTGDLGLVIERATGSIRLIETTGRSEIGQIDGLGDLSHAAAVYSRDGRHAYILDRKSTRLNSSHT